MNEQYIWPLVGVFLGWFLTTISSTYKDRNLKRRLIGNLLAKLIRIERQVEIIIASTEYIKDFAGSWEKYEPTRRGVLDRHFLTPESVYNDSKAAIDAIAPIYPLQAINLEDIFNALLKLKSASLYAILKADEESYLKTLSLHEVGLELNKQALTKAISILALKHGITTYFRLKISAAKRKKNIEDHASSIVRKIIDEVNDNVRNPHNNTVKFDAKD